MFPASLESFEHSNDLQHIIQFQPGTLARQKVELASVNGGLLKLLYVMRFLVQVERGCMEKA